MKIYVAWHDGGWGASGFVSHVSLDKEKLVTKCKKDCLSNPEIHIYDSETMEVTETCSKMIQYTDGHTCWCSECVPRQKIRISKESSK